MTVGPSNEELINWDPASRLVALVERIRPRYQNTGLAGLNEFERTLLALFEFDNEVCNGEFGSWLYQTHADLIAITLECLGRIGETALLEIVRSLLGELETKMLSDWATWEAELDHQPVEFWSKIANYDQQCGTLEREFVERLWSYARTVLTDVRMP